MHVDISTLSCLAPSENGYSVIAEERKCYLCYAPRYVNLIESIFLKSSTFSYGGRNRH
jgi:hypothetical protein